MKWEAEPRWSDFTLTILCLLWTVSAYAEDKVTR
jgi:hypothetical protein